MTSSQMTKDTFDDEYMQEIERMKIDLTTIKNDLQADTNLKLTTLGVSEEFTNRSMINKTRPANHDLIGPAISPTPNFLQHID
jgi:hypothetical protein